MVLDKSLLGPPAVPGAHSLLFGLQLSLKTCRYQDLVRCHWWTNARAFCLRKGSGVDPRIRASSSVQYISGIVESSLSNGSSGLCLIWELLSIPEHCRICSIVRDGSRLWSSALAFQLPFSNAVRSRINRDEDMLSHLPCRGLVLSPRMPPSSRALYIVQRVILSLIEPYSVLSPCMGALSRDLILARNMSLS